MLGCLVGMGAGMIDETAARAWWVRRLHPAGPCCPHCGVSLTGRQTETFASGGRVQCGDCRAFFSARTGTLLQGSQASWRELFLLVLLASAGASIFEIAKACGMSVDTVVTWLKRFREAGQ